MSLVGRIESVNTSFFYRSNSSLNFSVDPTEAFVEGGGTP